MQRSEIWWATLPPPVGSSPGGRRPVLILQSDRFNRSRISTIVIATITSNLNLASSPGNVLLPAASSGLYRDSVINVSQIATVDRSQLTEYVGTIPEEMMERVEEGVKLVLGLD
jgi:mRNA interferase MazF